MEIINKGIEEGLIALSEEKKQITYIHQNNKKRNFTNPEEIVQANTYVSLILHYGYKIII